MAHHQTLAQRLDALHYQLRDAGQFEAALELDDLAQEAKALEEALEAEDLDTANKIGALEDTIEDLRDELAQAKADLQRAEDECSDLEVKLDDLHAERSEQERKNV